LAAALTACLVVASAVPYKRREKLPGKEIIVLAWDKMGGWHSFLKAHDASVAVRHQCEVPCLFTEDRTRLNEADLVLMRGDLDGPGRARATCADPSQPPPGVDCMPPRPSGAAPSVQSLGVVHREALVHPLGGRAVKSAALSDRYDMRITYALEPRRADVVYSYMEDLDRWLDRAIEGDEATRAPGFHVFDASALPTADRPRDPRTAEERGVVSFVSMRCGRKGRNAGPGAEDAATLLRAGNEAMRAFRSPARHRRLDGRLLRTRLARALGAATHGALDAFGACARNRRWPEGKERSKAHVSRTHKFCLAVENTMDPGYHTEKLWDCLAAGAVPVYAGHPRRLAAHLPARGSAVLVADFETVEALAERLMTLAGDEAAWRRMRAWARHLPSMRNGRGEWPRVPSEAEIAAARRRRVQGPTLEGGRGGGAPAGERAQSRRRAKDRPPTYDDGDDPKTASQVRAWVRFLQSVDNRGVACRVCRWARERRDASDGRPFRASTTSSDGAPRSGGRPEL
jgi:hypothetical protein